MKQYYKVEVIKTLFRKKSYRKAFQIAFLILLGQFITGRRLVYKFNLSKRIPLSDIGDIDVISFSSLEQCKLEIGDMLKDTRSLNIPLDEYLADGRILWIGMKDNIIVTVACTSKAKVANYFIDLTDKQVAISRCETHPDYRGTGLYAKTLQKIVDHLYEAGIQAIYIDCNEWNWPSSRGIEKAGFEFIGYGLVKKGKLSFQPLSQSNNKL